MQNTTFMVKCPRCSLKAEAVIGEYNKFFLYRCPRCSANVVHFNDKTRTISDKMLKKLIKKGKLDFCGHISFNSKKHTAITDDDILNLKILLNLKSDPAEIIKYL